MNYNNNRVYSSYKGYHYIDLDGRPVKRTKFDYPYSYDEYVQWKGDYSKTDHAVYSDRIMRWDYDKFNKCCREVWGNEGQRFDNRSPVDIEKFLSLYYEEDIKLTAVMQGCNASNGYPYWIFFYANK